MIAQLLDLHLAITLPPHTFGEEEVSGLRPIEDPGVVRKFDWVFSLQQGIPPPVPADAVAIDPGPRFREAAASASIEPPHLFQHGAFNTIQWGEHIQVTYRLGRGTAEGWIRDRPPLSSAQFKAGVFHPLLLEGLRGRGVFPVDAYTVLQDGRCIELKTGSEITPPTFDERQIPFLIEPLSQLVVYQAHERALRTLLTAPNA